MQCVEGSVRDSVALVGPWGLTIDAETWVSGKTGPVLQCFWPQLCEQFPEAVLEFQDWWPMRDHNAMDG